MNFGGFQKLSLLNYPDKVACTAFTTGCNFRCSYCHNAELLQAGKELIPSEEILNYLQTREGMLEGICISGGEPLISDEILPFLQEVKQTGLAVKIDTNGSFPERLEKILSMGAADYIAMDIKNTPEKYAQTTGLKAFDMDPIFRSVDLLKQGRVDYEFRTTVVREFHDIRDIEEIGEWLKGAKVWYLQSFRDSPEVPMKGLHASEPEVIKKFCSVGNRTVKTIIRN